MWCWKYVFSLVVFFVVVSAIAYLSSFSPKQINSSSCASLHILLIGYYINQIMLLCVSMLHFIHVILPPQKLSWFCHHWRGFNYKYVNVVENLALLVWVTQITYGVVVSFFAIMDFWGTFICCKRIKGVNFVNGVSISFIAVCSTTIFKFLFLWLWILKKFSSFVYFFFKIIKKKLKNWPRFFWKPLR